MRMDNLLIECDNLKGLAYLRDDLGLSGKVDLVYIDPPFATGGSFSVDKDGRVATISTSIGGATAYEDNILGDKFIAYLRERVSIIYDLLSDSGSFYLHIDYKIGHYVKLMLDDIFGEENFRNDISRIKCNPKNFSRIGYGNIKDMVLYYTKSSAAIWNGGNDEASDDVWCFKDPQSPIYPTEKNHEMLRHIIRRSSNPESVVLDCFAGSGATLKCASELGRHWIGMDKSELAISTIRESMDAHGLFADEFTQYKYLEL